MKALCWILMGIVGIFLFFWMMIKGWGLEVKSVFPIVCYYVCWFVFLIIKMAIEKWDKE